jgi:hypothetical protein
MVLGEEVVEGRREEKVSLCGKEKTNGIKKSDEEKKKGGKTLGVK